MGIYGDFDKRLDRVLNRAIETAKGATINRVAIVDIVKDLTAMKRIFQEAVLLTDDTLYQAEVARINSETLERLAIEQAEENASAILISNNRDVFNFNDVGTVKDWLERVSPDVFWTAFAKLSPERQEELKRGL